MKKKITIIPFEEHDACNLFSICIDDDECEMMKFANKLIKDEKRDDLQKIAHQFTKIGEFGAEERFFRPAGKFKDNVWELPRHYIVKSNYRLYCLRYGTSVVILGNGGLKETRTYQEEPELHEFVMMLQAIDEKIKQLVNKGELMIANKQITGKLEFYI